MRPSTRCSRRSPPFPISLRFPRPADASTTPLDPPKERPRVNVNRRSFLRGTLSGAAGTALAGGVLAGGARADADQARGSGPATETAYPFHGPHQAGVLTPGPRDKQPFASVAAFDCTVANKPDLALLMYELTGRAWFLATGGTPPDLGVGQPPSDSDVLGPTVPADGLTITLSVGSSLFDDRYGLGNRKPLRLTEMPAFPNDFLEPPWLHGDLLLQLCANHPDTLPTPPPPPSPSTPAAACSCAGKWRATPPRHGRPGPRGTCWGSRTAPPTRPERWRAAWSGSTIPPSPAGRRAAPTRSYG